MTDRGNVKEKFFMVGRMGGRRMAENKIRKNFVSVALFIGGNWMKKSESFLQLLFILDIFNTFMLNIGMHGSCNAQ